MKKLTYPFTLLLILSGCKEEISEKDYIGLTGEELLLNLREDNKRDYNASVSDNEITIITKDEEYKLDMPKDMFYLAVAPYIKSTHPCYNHSATGCQGEMTQESFEVLVTNSNDEVVISQQITTLKNGFFELWLPRDISGTITVNYNGLTSTTDISTFSGDRTCLTTLQLN